MDRRKYESAHIRKKKPPIASILASPAVKNNIAGGVMSVVAQGAHKLGLVSIAKAEQSMTRV